MKVNSVDKKVAAVLSSKKEVVKDEAKLRKQQKYYRELTKGGIIRKQTYNLKPLSTI